MTPADTAVRPRQLSLAGDVARRGVGERPDREVEQARRGPESLRRELEPRVRRQPIGCSDGGGRVTLEQHVSDVWEALRAAGAAGCPLCGAEMHRTGAEARCGGCGTTLS